MRLFKRHAPQPWAGDFPIVRSRLYILPSRAGLIFAAALVAMLLTAVNYALSLGYVLIFTLAGVFLVSMFHTWRNMAGLIVRPGRTEPVHAGEIAEFSLTLHNEHGPERYAIHIDGRTGGHATHTVDVARGAEQITSIAIRTTRRGWHTAPRLRLSSDFPLGLWRAWSWWQPDAGYLVYPAPETPASPLPQSFAPDGHVEQHQQGGEDFSHIRPYRPGDSLRRLDWRAMARHPQDQALTREFSDGGVGGELLLDWDALPASLDTEARLSRLARWVESADGAGLPYALKLPGRHIATDHGPHHRATCLEALARFGEGRA